jgi:succinate dehydrogenase hydrophobic anchor subunit
LPDPIDATDAETPDAIDAETPDAESTTDSPTTESPDAGSTTDSPTTDSPEERRGSSDDEPERGNARASGRRPSLAVVAGVVSLLYVAWYVCDLVLLDVRPATFTAWHRSYGSAGGRAVFALAFLALVFHGLDGLRVTFADSSAFVRRHDAGGRAIVAFATFAVWIPTSLVLLWPAVSGWFSR